MLGYLLDLIATWRRRVMQPALVPIPIRVRRRSF